MPQTANPFDRFDKPPRSPIMTDPYKPAAERRADTGVALDQRRVDLQDKNVNREIDRTRLQNPQDLRQEYEKLAEVTTYRVALQQARRAMDTDANPQGDLALTYAFAKAMDPTSAVREGEQASVTNSQPLFQSLVERVKKQFGMDGAGSYTPEARAQLRQQIFRQVASIKPLYDRARADMTDNARAVGVDPKEVIGRDDTATYAPMFRDYGEKQGDPQGVISRLIGGEPIKGATPPTLAPDAAPGTAGYGATTGAMKIPDAMQQEYAAYLGRNWGKLDPGGFAAFRINLDRKYGFTSDAGAYRSDATKMNDIALKGQGPEVVGKLTAPERPLSAVEQLRNNAVDNPIGAGIAGAANMGGLGIPSLLAGDQYNAIRTAHPVATPVGEVIGGVLGAGKFGGAIRGIGNMAETRGLSTVANILSKPMTADVLYGGITGANDAGGRGENMLIGGLIGATGGYIGNRVGGAIAKAAPSLVGLGGAVRKLDDSVPTSPELKTLAGDLYSQAESKGLVAAPAETLALADTTKNILKNEGRLTPKDNLTDVQPKTKEAYRLIDEYAGEPMTPTQIQTVRGVIADGGASSDAAERRISRLLLDNFDNWTDGTNPDLASGLRDARGVASRYLQGDKIATARDLADVRAGQFSNSGPGNALRTDFRQLDRAIVRGKEQFFPGVEDAIADVARGNPVSNAFRFVGRFAPTGPVSAIPMLLAAGGGNAVAGPLGGAGALGLAGLAYGSRQIGQRMTQRAAQVAENAAYGGPDYSTALVRLLADAQQRGGSSGAGAIVGGTEPPVNDLIARLLAGQQEQPVPFN